MTPSDGTEQHAMDELIQTIKDIEIFSNLSKDIHREIAHIIETFKSCSRKRTTRHPRR